MQYQKGEISSFLQSIDTKKDQSKPQNQPVKKKKRDKKAKQDAETHVMEKAPEPQASNPLASVFESSKAKFGKLERSKPAPQKVVVEKETRGEPQDKSADPDPALAILISPHRRR